MREVDFSERRHGHDLLAIKTGKDFKTTLIMHAQSVRMGSLQAKKLLARAGLVQEKKWADAASKLKLALPWPGDANMRLSLAWVEQEVGDRLESEIQVFLTARLCGKQGNYPFHLGEPGEHVLGRFAILMGGVREEFLQPVLEAKPNHPDAKRAMEEIAKLEAAAGAARGSSGSGKDG